MDKGKKGIAEKIFYGAMNHIKQRTKTDGLKIFEKAIENVAPSVEVKSRRIGGRHIRFLSKFQKVVVFI
jgi:small subunit ribosomal protein S7